MEVFEVVDDCPLWGVVTNLFCVNQPKPKAYSSLQKLPGDLKKDSQCWLSRCDWTDYDEK